MSSTISSGRQTLPAPRLLEEETVGLERDRLAQENAKLTLRLLELETRRDETVKLREELARLRAEVIELRRRDGSAAPPIAARPSVEPRSRELTALPRESLASSAPVSGMVDGPLYAPGTLPTGAAIASVPTDGGLDFGTVSRLAPAEIDALPYGLICLDAQGRVVHYNDTEARLARLPREAVIGRNFFQDVAPCTRVREFEGQFYDLVRDPSRIRVRSFDFIFRFHHGEQHVTIVLTPARQRGLYNMALLRRRVA